MSKVIRKRLEQHYLVVDQRRAIEILQMNLRELGLGNCTLVTLKGERFSTGMSNYCECDYSARGNRHFKDGEVRSSLARRHAGVHTITTKQDARTGEYARYEPRRLKSRFR
jgi:hypothetical protein